MNLPKEAELLGSNTGPLALTDELVSTFVQLTDEGGGKLRANLALAAGEAASGRIYLQLAGIRGTRDAAVLSAYVQLPEAGSLETQRLLAGNIGLYGLRRASLPQAGNEGTGLTSVFDITAILAELLAASAGPVSEVQVSIGPSRQLADSPAITVGQVNIFYLPPG